MREREREAGGTRGGRIEEAADKSHKELVGVKLSFVCSTKFAQEPLTLI